MKVAEVYKYIDWDFPFYTAADFDNVGLLVGDMEKEVKTVLITLDCTKAAVKKAIEIGAEVIVSHHPFIFDPIDRIDSDSVINDCIKNDIAVIAAHTNLDTGKNGINDCIAEKLGITAVGGIYVDGMLLRKGKFSESMSAASVAALCKETFGGHVRYTDSGKMLSTVLICSGSGGSFTNAVLKTGVDAFITGEVRHHNLIEAADGGLSLFECGHFETENIILSRVTTTLKRALPDLVCYEYTGEEIKNA